MFHYSAVNERVITKPVIASTTDAWVPLGLVAGLLTTIGFVPQIVKGYKRKRMDDVSLSMPILLSIGMALWLGYDLVLNDLPIVLWNAIALLLNIVMIALKLRFKERSSALGD